MPFLIVAEQALLTFYPRVAHDRMKQLEHPWPVSPGQTVRVLEIRSWRMEIVGEASPRYPRWNGP